MLAWLSRYVDTFDGKITSTKGAQKYVTINLASFFTSTFGEFQTGLIKKNVYDFQEIQNEAESYHYKDVSIYPVQRYTACGVQDQKQPHPRTSSHHTPV